MESILIDCRLPERLRDLLFDRTVVIIANSHFPFLLMIKVFKEKFNNHEGYLVKKPQKEVGEDVSLHVGINCNAPLAPLTVLGKSE